jgi:hypothetical protein
MPKTKISEFSATPANNTDIDSIFIGEGMAPSNVNDAIRELMAQLKDWQSGTSNDPYVVGSSGSLTLNQGTANGVPYLNGSKVVTSGSAMTFDGTNLILGSANPLLQGSSSTGSVAISNNSAGAYIRVYGSSHATRPNYTDFINGSSTSTFDASGNLGLGVTPSAWGAGTRAFQIGSGTSLWNPGSSTNTLLLTNAYNDGTNYIYRSSSTASYYAQSGAQHQWFNAPSGTAGNAITFTQAMTLDSSGNLLVGTTSNAALQNNNSLVVRAVGDTIQNHANGTSSGAGYLFFGYNGGAIGSITQTGTTAVLFNTTSDQRLKENIQDADSASSLIDSLKVRQFDWKSDNSHQRYGFVAQELVTVAPEAVHQPEDAEQMMAVDYSKLVPMLVKEVQSLRQRVAQLEGN